MAQGLQADAVFIAPPWGSEENSKLDNFDIFDLMPDIEQAVRASVKISSRLLIYLPRNVSYEQIAYLIYNNTNFDSVANIDVYYLDKSLKSI